AKLFDKTIYENMTYGSDPENTSDNTSDNISKILKIIDNTGVFKNITNFNTYAGVAGSNLSGGQKQIINFVRAILRKTPILILDEPTSGLDINTKTAILSIIKSI